MKENVIIEKILNLEYLHKKVKIVNFQAVQGLDLVFYGRIIKLHGLVLRD